MNQLKRYLFWWVCGAVLVVELCLIGFFSPTDDDGRSPEDVKGQLDGKYKELAALHGRASKAMTAPFDAEEKVDIDHLTKDYLITEKWEGVLKPAVDKYQQQLDGIASDLADRSRPLRDPLIDTGDLYEWQRKYLDESERLLQRLDAANQLVIPEKPAEKGKTTAAPIDDSTRFRDDADVRKLLGFETPKGSTLQVDRHAELTAKLRIVAQIVDTLTRIDAEVVPNPAVNHGLTTLPTQKPKLVGLTWQQPRDAFKGTFEKRISASYVASVKLLGAESALLVAVARFEQIEKPIVVVTAATVAREPRVPAAAEKRLGGPDLVLPAIATVDLLVLDMGPAVAAKETK